MRCAHTQALRRAKCSLYDPPLLGKFPNIFFHLSGWTKGFGKEVMAGRGSSPGTPRVLRAMNDRVELGLLLARGPLSQALLVQLSGLSKPTTALLLSPLEEERLMVRTRRSKGHPGPDPPDMPIEFENDVNLAAVAERQAGAARGSEDDVLLWNESGIGGVIVIGGRTIRGHTGGAGEIAFLRAPDAPPLHQASKVNDGGFQSVAGPPAIFAKAHALTHPPGQPRRDSRPPDRAGRASPGGGP